MVILLEDMYLSILLEGKCFSHPAQWRSFGHPDCLFLVHRQQSLKTCQTSEKEKHASRRQVPTSKGDGGLTR